MRIAILALVLLAGCGGSSAPTLAERGQTIAQDSGCQSCHSVDGSGLVGPSWQGLAGRRVTLSDGTVVIADDAYLRESILQPSAKTVKGFEMGLMETAIRPNSFSDQQVRALIAYIKSLTE